MPEPVPLARATPEAVGIDSNVVLAFIEAAEKKLDALHGFMLLRHGRVVAEGWWAPYTPDSPHQLFSLSKSFTSTAIGLAVAEGRLSVDDRVLSFFLPSDAPDMANGNLAAMRVCHLLSMSTGHVEDTTGPMVSREDGNWARGFLSLPVEKTPGTHFVYNSGATYMLSAIVQRVTGKTLLEYLIPRLFEPLGIRGASWETCPRGINTGGWGLNIRTEDIARFGSMVLNRGVWNERRILPEAWVREATQSHISNGTDPNSDWAQGYGYQFWRCRHGAFRGDGAFGQYCIVMPEQDAVMAINAGLGDMQAPLNLVWEILLPAMKPDPLPESDAAGDLKRKLATLALVPMTGAIESPAAKRVSGRIFSFEPNDQKIEAVTLDFNEERCVLTVREDGRSSRVVCGRGEWQRGETTLDSGATRKIAASGAWTADDTYSIRLCFTETPFRPTITCRFDGDRLYYQFKSNVGFGPVERTQLISK